MEKQQGPVHAGKEKTEIDYSSGNASNDPKSKDQNLSANSNKSQVSLFALFKYADRLDIFMMTVGTFFSMGLGSIQPIVSLVLGNIIQAFIDYAYIKELVNNGQLSPDSPQFAASKQKVSDEVIFNVILFSAIGASAFFAAYFSRALWISAGERQAHRIRQRFLSSILIQDVKFFDKNEVGDLTTRLSVDTSVYQEGISDKVAMAIVFSTTFVAGFVIAFVRSWFFTLILLSTVPVLMGAGMLVGKSIAAAAEGSSASYAKAGAIAQETLSNIRTVTAFNGQDKALKRFEVFLEVARNMNEKKALKMGVGFGLFFGLLYGVYALAFWSGSLFAANGLEGKSPSLNGGDVLNVIFAIIIGAFSIIGLAPSVQAISKAQGVASKLFEVIDLTPEMTLDDENARKLAKVEGRIEFKNVVFEYPSRPNVTVLHDFSLVVEPGTTVALVGFSGSGKSTIIQLLERFYDPVSGDIILDDFNIKSLNLKSLRQSFGLVSQEPILFDATIEENIRYGASDPHLVTQDEIVKASKAANAHEFISKLTNGYDTRVGEKGALLSGGQKQRIAIARALLKNPRVLLLDEATSALDAESERIVQDTLDKVSKDRTTITIAHRLSTIKNADKIVVMEHGKIVEIGKHAELISRNGSYAGLVRAQEMKTKPLDDGLIPGSEVVTGLPSVTGEVAVNIAENVKKTGITEDEEISEEELIKLRNQRILRENKTPLFDVLMMQKSEWKYLIAGIFGAAGNGALLPIFGLIFGQVLAVFSLTDPDQLKAGAAKWSLVFLGLMFANFILNVLQFGSFGVAGERLTRKIRSMMFQAILRQEIAYFDDRMNGTGALTARLSDEAEKIQSLTGPTFGTILQVLVSLVVSLGASFYYSWQMTLCVLAVTPLLIMAGYLENKVNFQMAADDSVKKSYSAASQTSCDAIANIRTVKSLVIEKMFVDVYMSNIDVPHKLGFRRAFLASLGYGFSQGMGFWLYAISFYAGYRFVFADIIPAGSLFTVLFCIVFGAISFSQAASFGIDITKARVASIAFFELINRVPSIDIESEEGAKPVDVEGKVSLEKTKFSYPQRSDIPILKGIDIDVLAGKNIALVGPSGSGKSTIVALLERFYDPVEGKVSAEGTLVKDWNLRYLRNNISIVSQEPSLFSGTIAENIKYAVPDSTNEQMEEAGRMANIHDFIMSLPNKYDTEITNTQLSGGQKQRISIARALLCKPKILLLDEATSALDSESEKVVQEALNTASKGRTSITIAHRLSTIQDADLIIVMKDGEIVESGKHLELLEKNGLYSVLVQRQKLGTS